MIGRSAGLKKGDHILKINNWPVESTDDLYKLLKALVNSGDLVVTIERDGDLEDIQITPSAAEIDSAYQTVP